ncbi:ABC transporter substrate-binding protein [Candidatus Endomicrobiellum devescovinae]|uniref:ABC transporter substrate-binding protein n=1 Tax=Candidatus Endomicrobiellum devescovinae TaxID=3242322 RepID=UPI003594361C
MSGLHSRFKWSKMTIRKSIFVLIILLLSTFFLYAKEYTRIVSLAPSVTKSLYELGAESYVKGITVFCPKGSIKKEIIGTLLEPNIEKIAYINPDLIIASKDGNDRAVVDKLRRLGFEVYVMEKSESFKDICSNYRTLAEKINRAKEASNTISKAEVYVDRLHSKLSKSVSLRVFWEIGNNPLYTAGGKSFANDYNAYSNTINAYNDINKNYFQVFREDVMKRNPDIILLVNLGNMSKEELSFWRKYKMLNAVQNNRVFIIDSEDMFAPTPLTFAENLSFLAKIVYGDVLNVK